MRPNRSLPLALAACLCSCIAVQRDPGVTIATSPPGARVVIDGIDSGFVTPIDLGVSRRAHTVTLELEGYLTAERKLRGASSRDVIHYDEAYISENTWHFPMWLNYQDGFFPFKYHKSYRPRRIFVRLRLAGGE
jgi:hypothetical protein